MLSFTPVGFRRSDRTWEQGFTDAQGSFTVMAPDEADGLMIRSYAYALGGRDYGSLTSGSLLELHPGYLTPRELLSNSTRKGLAAQRLVPIALEHAPEGMMHLKFYAYDPTDRQFARCAGGPIEVLPEPILSVLMGSTHVLEVPPAFASIGDDTGVEIWMQGNAAKSYPGRQVHAVAIANGSLYGAVAPARVLPRQGQTPLALRMGHTSLEWLPNDIVRKEFQELQRKVSVTAIWLKNTKGELVASTQLRGLDATRYSIRTVPTDDAAVEHSPKRVTVTETAAGSLKFVLDDT